MRGLALALLAAAARADKPPTDCSYTSISPGKLFGVGGRSTQGYADREYKCWKLRGNSHVTLVMDFFETERQMGDAGRFEAPVPDEVPKIEMRKVGDARVSPLHYGDDAAEGV